MEAKEFMKLYLKVIKKTNPITYAVVETVGNSIKKMSEVSSNGSIDDLQNFFSKQKVEMQLAELQAKVAQEIAIARRIESAEEVILEEYYEGEGKGNLGLNVVESSVVLGLAGEGRRISKRVYTFKGGRDVGLEGVEECMEEDVEEGLEEALNNARVL